MLKDINWNVRTMTTNMNTEVDHFMNVEINYCMMKLKALSLKYL